MYLEHKSIPKEENEVKGDALLE